jgi:hypothetical protein
MLQSDQILEGPAPVASDANLFDILKGNRMMTKVLGNIGVHHFLLFYSDFLILNDMSDPEWHSLLRQLLIEYVTLLTNPEGTSPSAPSLKRQECLEHDISSEEACAATASAAGGGGGGGAGGGNGGNGGNSGGDGDGDEDEDEDEDDDGSGLGEEEAAGAKPAASKPKGKGAGKPGRKKK